MRTQIHEVAPNVFRQQVFAKRAAAAFLKELDACYVQDGQPNSMNKYGKVLSTRKAPWLAEMVEELVQPIAFDHFDELRRLKRYPYAFTVEYDVKKQRSLASHYDSSAVTLNICLAGDFQGGDVVFYGDGYGADERKRYVVKNEVGYGIVHRGAHVHRATKLTKGTRTNLIFWCQERLR